MLDWLVMITFWGKSQEIKFEINPWKQHPSNFETKTEVLMTSSDCFVIVLTH